MLTGPDWENTYVTEILPAKLQIELDYLSVRTLSTDVRILAQTASALFTRPTRHVSANRGSQCRS
jgi:lipopolysaccharide/colanic/teichoic acid biosynthesis glycosyltransferase